MAENMENLPVIVGVRFSKIGKNYFFDATKVEEVEVGDYLIVETSRGWQIGELSEIITDPKIRSNTKYKPVDRKAMPKDLEKKDRLALKADEIIRICQKELNRLGIDTIKIISSEISFDEKNLSFIYSCCSEETPNLNPLKSALGKIYPNMHIDYHKIGPRDVARYLGGMGACGLTCRCCSKFLKNFESISINMAKKQGISLTPSEITGMCDRLRCCLQYEYCYYVEALNHLPRKNKLVQTPKGMGKIVDIAPLTQKIYVLIDEIGVKEFSADEIIEDQSAEHPKPSHPFQSKEKEPKKKQRSKGRKWQ